MDGTSNPLRADAPASVPDVTRLLNDASGGDPQAAVALLPLVYDQLRRLARQKMRNERPEQTLQATALVHEAFLRLVGGDGGGNWKGRWHFFAAAAEAMRRILVEDARRKSRQKRGGDRRRVTLEDLTVTIDERPEELLALDEALSAFATVHPEKANLVQLRYFAGLTNEEAAQALGISSSTADRHWAFAKAWLYRRITKSEREGEASGHEG
jgi:RNA polymerase sigma factor (TIGR02999 family)